MIESHQQPKGKPDGKRNGYPDDPPPQTGIDRKPEISVKNKLIKGFYGRDGQKAPELFITGSGEKQITDQAP
jgi:hypothetical protein